MARLLTCGLAFVLIFNSMALAATDTDKFVTDYMTEKCNQKLSGRVSGRIETSTALTYDNLMDCATTISVSSGKRVFIYFKRFDVEESLDGVCVDAFNVHDGPSRTAATLNTQELCGFLEDLGSMYSTGNEVTLSFTSDGNAVYRGFEIIYTEFTWAPCSANEFRCDNNICIDPDLECDGVSQCGDDSDESIKCDEQAAEDEVSGLNMGLIVGCSFAGLVVIIIIVIVVYKAYDHYKWKHWMDKNSLRQYPWEESDGDLYQYPVTDLYNKYDVGIKGRRHQMSSETSISTEEVVTTYESSQSSHVITKEMLEEDHVIESSQIVTSSTTGSTS